MHPEWKPLQDFILLLKTYLSEKHIYLAPWNKEQEESAFAHLKTPEHIPE
jgi:hypothetical protein